MEKELTPSIALSRALLRAAEKHDVPNLIEVALDLNPSDAAKLTKLELLQAELNALTEKIRALEEMGVNDYYSPTMLFEAGADTFLPDKSGWSYFNRFTYKDRKKQFEPRLPKGAGIVYVLGVVGNPGLSKIGFTTITAHDRALDYGKVHDLDLFVYDQVSCSDAKALEKLVHQKLKNHRHDHNNSRELFSITPKFAASEIRNLEPSASPEVLSRDLQWLHLQSCLSMARLAKEQWQELARLRNIFEVNKRDAVRKFGPEVTRIQYEEHDQVQGRLDNHGSTAHVATLLSDMQNKLIAQKTEIFLRKVRKSRDEIRKKSKLRWKSRYEIQLKERRKILLLSGLSGAAFLVLLVLGFYLTLRMV